MLKELFKRKMTSYPLSINVALIAVFTALTTVFTVAFSIPFPLTSGYFNIGEVGVYLSGLLWGPVIGGISGGLGSMFGDLILGYPMYAPWTLLIKGLEGFIVGLISRRTTSYLDGIGVAIGGLIMISGYLLTEALILGFGFEYAISEAITINIPQFVIGALIAIPISIIIRRSMALTPYQKGTATVSE
ncbi:MAG: ECF transporter S component [Candidatus Odinarchaeia archaeon]